MRITQNPNGSINIFGMSRAKAQALVKAFYLLLNKEPDREIPKIDAFDLRMVREFLSDLEDQKEIIWK